jgi:hypothetical protein
MQRVGALMSAAIETDQQAGVSQPSKKSYISWVGSTAAMCGPKSDGLALIPRRLAKTRKD